MTFLVTLLFTGAALAAPVGGFKLVTQSGQPQGRFAFSPDGKLLATGDGHVWDVRSGALVAAFPAAVGYNVDRSATGPVALSSTGLIAVQTARRTEVYDLRTEARRHSFFAPAPLDQLHAAFSPDGKFLVTANGDTLRIYDMASGQQILNEEEKDGRIFGIAFAPDGAQLAVAQAHWKDPATSVVIRAVPGFAALRSFPVSPTRATVAFAAGNTLLVSREPDTNPVQVVPSLYDAASGKLLGTIAAAGKDGAQAYAAISPDGQRVAACIEKASGFGRDCTLQLFAAQQGTPIGPATPLFLKPSSDELWRRGPDGEANIPRGGTHLGFSADGSLLAARTGRGLALFDGRTGAPLRTIAGSEQDIFHVAFSRDGKHLAAAGGNTGEAVVWDLATLRAEVTLRPWKSDKPDPNDVVYDVAFDPSGELLALRRQYSLVVYQWRTATRLCDQPIAKRDVIDHTGEYPLLFASTDRLLVGARSFDGRTCAEGKEVKGPENYDRAVASPDGKLFAFGNKNAITFVDAATAATVRRVALPTTLSGSRSALDTSLGYLRWSMDSRSVYFDVRTGNDLFRIDVDGSAGYYQDFGRDPGPHRAPLKGSIKSVAASPKLLVYGDDTGQVAVWELDNKQRSVGGSPGKLRYVLTPQASPVNDLAFNPADPDLLAVAGPQVKLIRFSTGQEVNLVSRGGEWIAAAFDGIFDSSKDGGALVAMVRDAEPFGVDQFAVRNNRPDILLTRMGLGEAGAIAHFRGQFERRLRRAGLTEEDIKAEPKVPVAQLESAVAEGSLAKLAFSCTDQEREVRSYNIFVNDVPVVGGRGGGGKALSGHAAQVEETIALSQGTNKIEVSCVNDASTESFRALRVLEGPAKARKPDLWFLGFGVSRYADPRLRLQYASKDARDLAAAFRGMKRGFGAVHAKTFLDEEVTPAAIRDARAYLKDAAVDDVLVLFIAGHGVHDEDKDATYYFLTQGAKVDDLAHTAAPFELIEDLLVGVQPRRKLFLMDTCESGERDQEQPPPAAVAAASNSLRSRGVRLQRKEGAAAASTASRPFLLARDRYIFNDLARRSGAIVFSSSRGAEFSYETAAAKNGIFTKQLLAGLAHGEADQDRDGIVTVDELRAFVSSTVPKLTSDLQHPTVDRDNLFVKFGFPAGRK